MLERDVKARLADYFTSEELVAFLQLPIDDVIDAFEDEVEEALDELEEFIDVKRK